MKIFLNEKKTLVCHQRPLQNTLSRIKIIVSNESLDKKKKKQFGGFMIFSTDYTAQLRCEMDPSMYQKGQNRNKKLCKEGFWAFGLSLPNQIILNFKIKKLGFFLLCGAWGVFFFFRQKVWGVGVGNAIFDDSCAPKRGKRRRQLRMRRRTLASWLPLRPSQPRCKAATYNKYFLTLFPIILCCIVLYIYIFLFLCPKPFIYLLFLLTYK